VLIGGERFRLLVRDAPPAADGTPRTVGVARPVGDVEQVLEEVTWVLGITAFVAAAIALVLGLVIGRRALRPLIEARGAAERVAAAQDPSLRIPEGRPDGVGRLARAMNRMLERLEAAQGRLRRSLDEQRRFAADASHELRTPLTALRGDLDLVRSYPLPEDERETVLDEMGAAIERMDRTVAGLLGLARSEGSDAARAERVDVDELATSLVRRGEGLVVAPGAEAAAVMADPDLVRAVVVNLIENARRHGERVELRLRREGADVVLTVQDDGPGVAPEDRERIFDRFYRAPTLRGSEGSGLGLPIARTAAEALGGSVRLLDQGPGAVFEVRLPAAEADVSTPAPAELA
ncbi:MAG: HAMP domain-containing sensor histidine kinase, partial [Miltoncostaeaceae bacterium]